MEKEGRGRRREGGREGIVCGTDDKGDTGSIKATILNLRHAGFGSFDHLHFCYSPLPPSLPPPPPPLLHRVPPSLLTTFSLLLSCLLYFLSPPRPQAEQRDAASGSEPGLPLCLTHTHTTHTRTHAGEDKRHRPIRGIRGGGIPMGPARPRPAGPRRGTALRLRAATVLAAGAAGRGIGEAGAGCFRARARSLSRRAVGGVRPAFAPCVLQGSRRRDACLGVLGKELQEFSCVGYMRVRVQECVWMTGETTGVWVTEDRCVGDRCGKWLAIWAIWGR